MSKYYSNNYFLLDRIIYIVLLIGVAVIITYQFAVSFMFLLVGVLIIFLLVGLLVCLLLKLVTVEFIGDKVVMRHLFLRRHTSIYYTAIAEVQHLFWYPVFSRNVFKYKDGKRGKVMLLTSVRFLTGGLSVNYHK